MGPVEARGLDPAHRGLLETTYRALENAGIPTDEAAGSRTSVHIGSFGSDYMAMQIRDPLKPSQYSATGVSQSFLANRLSWFFDFKGPSMAIDTACSSSLVAFDRACEAILSNDCTMGIVGGVGLFFDPYQATTLANLKALSPDSRSYSFDARANGYGRGEGFGVLVLKRLSQAVKDGNMIRAVVRSTMTNADGKTPAITQPSAAMQEALIRAAYQKRGLDMQETTYFEAHATGTPVGDPAEIRAVASAFSDHGKSRHPLTMLSVSAFGIGGTNAHAVIDDACSYLDEQAIDANHHTAAPHGQNTATDIQSRAGEETEEMLLILSSFDKPGIKRLNDVYVRHFDTLSVDDAEEKAYLTKLVRTVNFHRSSMPWRSFAVFNSLEGLRSLLKIASKPVRSSAPRQLAFVFTGQGSQWAGMGRQLLKNEVFRASLEQSAMVVRELGGKWNLIGNLESRLYTLI
ncbi:MAG: hypothetical protein Q9162_003514 [Coniocarpon cinnabarinum]